MPPLRRYIRISHHHTMLALIYVDDPADLNSWLIHPSKPALPRIVEALRDVVPAKLREELELERRSNKKNRLRTSDVVVGDDFEVHVYLRDNPKRHAILLKHRVFGQKPKKLKSNSNRLGVGSDAGTDEDGEVRILQEEEDDGDGDGNKTLSLNDIPLFKASQTGDDDDDDEDEDVDDEEEETVSPPTSSHGTRSSTRITRASRSGRAAADSDRMAIFVEDEEMEEESNDDGQDGENSDGSFEEATNDRGTSTRSRNKSRTQMERQTDKSAPSRRGKRRRETITLDDNESDTESRPGQPAQRDNEELQMQMQMQMQDELHPHDEKKPLLKTTYEGFSIFGKALYMIVKRIPSAGSTSGAMAHSSDVGAGAGAGGAAPAHIRTGDDSARPPEGVLDEWMIMSQTIGEGNDE